MSIDVEGLRALFPALQQRGDDGRPFVFFDNPAGTQVPQTVIEAVGDYYRSMNANSGGSFETSRRSDAMVAGVRAAAADFLNASVAEEIVFGPNMTTLTFALSRALAQTLQPGDEIVLTRMDHDANVAPWLCVAARHGLVVRMVDFTRPECLLDLDSLEAALTERTRIVATTHASNAAGSLNPCVRLRQWHMPRMRCTWSTRCRARRMCRWTCRTSAATSCSVPAYKFYGPHLGVLWGRHDLLAELPVDKVRPAKDLPPWRWETGTASFETIAGLGATLDYLTEIGRTYGAPWAATYAQMEGRRQLLKTAMAALADHERSMCQQLLDVLQTLPGLQVMGVTDPTRLEHRVPTVIFSVAGRVPADIAAALGERGIFVWSGDYYAQELMEGLGQGADGMVRVGLAHYNTPAEIQRLGETLEEVLAVG